LRILLGSGRGLFGRGARNLVVFDELLLLLVLGLIGGGVLVGPGVGLLLGLGRLDLVWSVLTTLQLLKGQTVVINHRLLWRSLEGG
jgi:hypothetical protein